MFLVWINWRIRPADEMRRLRLDQAGRISYLAVVVTLLAGIIYQTITTHHVDVWLVLALAVAVVAKSLPLLRR